jgi:hypothetical protein
MTIEEAIRAVQEVGVIEADRERFKLRVPVSDRIRLEPAIEVLRRDKEAALAVLRSEQSLEDVLDGKAVELWSDAAGDRFWIVADEKDAATLMRLEGVGRGAIYTAPEVRLIIRMDDPETAQMIHRWKLETHGVVREVNRRA